jgi:anti-sigma regulatory factor (Ser/Thr protein kinase)
VTRTTPSLHLKPAEHSAPGAALREAIDGLGERYGLGAEQLFELKVAATEALTNALRGASSERGVDVSLGVREDAVEIEVQNNGTFELGDPALFDIESEGGRGIPLMIALVDEVEFASTRAGMRVRLRKRLRGPRRDLWGAAPALS